jgi:hypothetical protein
MMLSYETLDTIADAYTPLLAIVSLAFIITPLLKAQWCVAALRLLTVSALLAITYGLMLVDGRFNIWLTFGLDYSTHTAVALVLVAFLAANQPRLTVFWVGSLIAYLLLMLYQGYHTTSDIVVTAVVVVAPAWLVIARLCNRWPFTTHHNESLNQMRKSSAT